ncbi:Ig-like domain-containing protein [Patescibacteria group bacterium]|nr:Ig-like domain-containing protein [Patescibacteria group bacterium]
MAYSRLSRFEEKRQKRRLIYSLLGSVAILAFIFFFGFKLLVNFSVLLEKFQGGSGTSATQSASVNILPPALDPLPEATNSADLTVTGKGQPGLTVILYANGTEASRLPVDSTGLFRTVYTADGDGAQTISAKLTDNKGNVSDLSNIISTTVKRSKPTLTIDQPGENATVNGDPNTTTVSGKTDPEDTVTINGRVAVVRDDGSFSYTIQLNEGDNILTATATDTAGNETTVERHVSYHP